MFEFNHSRKLLACLLLGASVTLVACKPTGASDKAPEGFAIIREHMIFIPQNVPPVASNLDFTIVEVDGASVVRERPPFLVDMQPGALIAAGLHSIKAIVAPHMRPPNYQPKQVTFDATVQSGTVYFLVDDKDGNPVLVEDHPGSK